MLNNLAEVTPQLLNYICNDLSMALSCQSSLKKVFMFEKQIEYMPDDVCVSDEDNERLNADLEDQYRHGLEMKMSGCARRHTGLGFSEPEPPPPASETPSEAGTDVAESTDGDGDSGVPLITAENSSKEADEKVTEERKDSSKSGARSSDAKKPTMIGFVHGGSAS